MAELSPEEREEFLEARQAIEILDRFKPQQAAEQSAIDQAAIESASIQRDVTPAIANANAADVVPTIEKLGHYQILETLGQGGFGVVVKARDTKLGRYAATENSTGGGFIRRRNTAAIRPRGSPGSDARSPGNCADLRNGFRRIDIFHCLRILRRWNFGALVFGFPKVD